MIELTDRQYRAALDTLERLRQEVAGDVRASNHVRMVRLTLNKAGRKAARQMARKGLFADTDRKD